MGLQRLKQRMPSVAWYGRWSGDFLRVFSSKGLINWARKQVSSLFAHLFGSSLPQGRWIAFKVKENWDSKENWTLAWSKVYTLSKQFKPNFVSPNQVLLLTSEYLILPISLHTDTHTHNWWKVYYHQTFSHAEQSLIKLCRCTLT